MRPDGARYEGEYKDDKRNGHGVHTWPDGARYEGEYKDGNSNGHGVHTWPDGRRYEGEFKDGNMNGHGVHTWPSGQRYEGEFKDGKKNGHGVHTWPDGARYEGEFKDDKKNGHGVHTWPDGGRYEGEFKDDKKNGHGVHTWPDGGRYEGEFKDGKKNGHGVHTWPGLLWGTSVREGIWDADSLSVACDVTGCAAESVAQARQAGKRARLVAANAATATQVLGSASSVEAGRKAALAVEAGRKASAAAGNAVESASKASREATEAGKSGSDARQRQRARTKEAKKKKEEEEEKEAEKARAQREKAAAEEEEAAKAQEVREEAEKANARREEEEATKAEEAAAAAAAAAEQRAAAKAARMRNLHKFLGAANFEEYFDKLTNYGIESVEDLCLATADDLAGAGVTKPFHRRKLLAAAAKWSNKSGQTESDTIILSKITEHMRTGDNHLAEDECAVARDAYATALSMAQELKLTVLVTVLDWKVYKADFCLGAAVLPLSGPGTEDATCGISTLANELLLSDFDIAASRFGFRRVQHWDEWFKLFGLTQQSCSPKALKRSYYRRMVKYHPDKFNGPQHCATMMALILNAGKELLDSHSACANEREL